MTVVVQDVLLPFPRHTSLCDARTSVVHDVLPCCGVPDCMLPLKPRQGCNWGANVAPTVGTGCLPLCMQQLL